MAEHARPIDAEVRIPIDGGDLEGRLTLPSDVVGPSHSVGIVVFAHGSGSSRHSPRNLAVAEVLHGRGLGTLLFDLLRDDEAADRGKVFDVELLGTRLATATRWLRERSDVGAEPIGYFGASTGAAAALWAAAEDPGIRAVVSRGGRPDLAGERLRSVRCPTLLIVGGADRDVLELNERAAGELVAPHEIHVVPDASHLFEEPGTLGAAARAAAGWFVEHLPPAKQP